MSKQGKRSTKTEAQEKICRIRAGSSGGLRTEISGARKFRGKAGNFRGQDSGNFGQIDKFVRVLMQSEWRYGIALLDKHYHDKT